MIRRIAVLLWFCSVFGNTIAQIKISDGDIKEITSPKNIQRTMHLLANSTPEHPNTVRILIYGQSLSAQDWWQDVKEHLENEYPNANLIMTNKAIGGFSSEILVKTVERDMLDYYPDLVIFHVFGSDGYYEEVLKIMRSRTSTEVLIWNDPQNKVPKSEWNTKMSYEIVPGFTAKYHCGFIDLRTPIQKMIEEKNLVYADEFTKDGTHFNEKGIKLIASQIIPHLIYDEELPADPHKLCSIYEIGEDVHWKNGELMLPFEGNRVDVVNGNSDSDNNYQVYIDNKKASEFLEAYNYTRPNDNGASGWIWSVAAPVRIRHQTPRVNETFTLTFDSINYDLRYFTFHVEGSECGFEGKGNNREDFISRSGRVFIEANEVHDSIPGDWHVFRNYDVLQFKIEKGYKTTWKTYFMGVDEFAGRSEQDGNNENTILLCKGIPNGKHVLKLVAEKDKLPNIKRIKIYKPLLKE